MSQRKADAERTNRVPRVHPTTYIVWDGKTRGEPLPERSDGKAWSRETLEWWEFVRNSAQSMLMHPSDWLIMKVAAEIHNQMFSSKSVLTKAHGIVEAPCTPGELKSLSAEFRAHTAPYGFTHADRNRYGINIVTPEDLETEATQAAMKAARVVGYREKFS